MNFGLDLLPDAGSASKIKPFKLTGILYTVVHSLRNMHNLHSICQHLQIALFNLIRSFNLIFIPLKFFHLGVVTPFLDI